MLHKSVVSIILAVFFLVSQKAEASSSEAHVRYGLISASYSGPTNGKFLVPTTIDVEYEFFQTNTHSYFLRGIFAEDYGNTIPYYTYAGLGMHFYFNSKGMTTEESERGVTITSSPIWRYYFGWDAGMAQVTIKTLGPVLSVVSTTVDVGAHLGVIYQIDRKFGIEGQLGVTGAYGFSAVTVTGFTGRLFVGGTLFF